MASTYWAQTAAFPTTASTALLATGTTVKTLLQVATPSSQKIKVIEWGIDFDAPGSAGKVQVELIQTDVAATVTAQTPQQYFDPNDLASACVGGTALTGFNASAEGTITATRLADLRLITPPFSYLKQWPLGREFGMHASKFLRVRVTATVTCNAYAYIVWEE